MDLYVTGVARRAPLCLNDRSGHRIAPFIFLEFLTHGGNTTLHRSVMLSLMGSITDISKQCVLVFRCYICDDEVHYSKTGQLAQLVTSIKKQALSDPKWKTPQRSESPSPVSVL